MIQYGNKRQSHVTQICDLTSKRIQLTFDIRDGQIKGFKLPSKLTDSTTK
jgi:hypothetical protein